MKKLITLFSFLKKLKKRDPIFIESLFPEKNFYL